MPTIERLSLEVLGERLRSRRRELKQSQQELAQLMDIPQSWISELENGKRPHVEADTVYRFCRALNISADYVLGLTDDRRPRQRQKPAAAADEKENAA